MIKFSRTHYFGNDTCMDCRIGDVFQKAENDFIFLGNIFEDIPQLKREECIKKSNPITFTLTSESGVSIDMEAKYGVSLEKAEVRIRFENKHSAFVYLNNSVTYSLAMGNIRNYLYKYWQKKQYIDDVKNYCLINTLLQAESGKIIFSKCNNTSVTLGHSAGMPISTLEGIADARVKIMGEASSIGSIEAQNAQPIVQLVRWYKKWNKNKFRFM